LIKFRASFKHYLRKNFLFYMIFCIAFLLGIIIGSMNYIMMPKDENTYLNQYMGSFFSAVSSDMPNLSTVFQSSIIENTKTVLIMWVFGFSLIGIPLCLFIVGIRGFAFGFAVSSFVGLYGFKGILIALCALFPQLIIYIPALLAAGVTVLEFSLYFSCADRKDSKRRLLQYLLLALVFLGIFLISSLLESYVSPILIKLVSKLVVVH